MRIAAAVLTCVSLAIFLQYASGIPDIRIFQLGGQRLSRCFYYCERNAGYSRAICHLHCLNTLAKKLLQGNGWQPKQQIIKGDNTHSPKCSCNSKDESNTFAILNTPPTPTTPPTPSTPRTPPTPPTPRTRSTPRTPSTPTTPPTPSTPRTPPTPSTPPTPRTPSTPRTPPTPSTPPTPPTRSTPGAIPGDNMNFSGSSSFNGERR